MDDLAGIDVDVMGAMAQQLMRTNPNLARRVMQQRPAAIRQPPSPQLPVNQVQAATLRSFLGLVAPGTGLPFITWTGTDAADKSLEVEPQESYEGKRLIISVARSTGAAASVIVVKTLFVGSQPQSPSVSGGTTVDLFSADATSADLDLQIAYRANKITLNLAISAAPGGTESVVLAAGFYGNWIRGS
jgi:hypothetical protein